MKRIIDEVSPIVADQVRKSGTKNNTEGDEDGKDRKGGKMNPKKKKRLDNYIKKKLAKEEKSDLMAKLAKSSFTSDLMQSSRSLGQGKMTTREKLRHAMNQQKAGIPISDPSVRLLVERDVAEYQNAPQGKVQLSLGNVSKAAAVLSNIPLKIKKKNTMVSVKELLKKVRPHNADGSDEENDGTDSSFDSSASESGDEIPVMAEPKDLEKAPTTSIEYLQAPSAPLPVLKIKTKPVTKKNEAGPKKFYVTVKRDDEISAARMLLPVYGEEQVIMERLAQNDVLIICGETGSGKTTQVPQFLYEAGYGHPDSPNPGMVAITQPRRVAAVSMASRVAMELGDGAQFVSYQIRYDATTTKDTRIKFMTDGVLLREMAQDFLLNKYSVIIVDEAHERTLNTDILIGALSRIIRLRNKFFRDGKPGVAPLKLVVMSATLRVKDFVGNTALFPDTPPPVLEIKARQHPVTVHFNKRTPEFDYVGEAFKKVVKIHTRLPAGGILIFLTGQNEILDLCRRLNRRFPSNAPLVNQAAISVGVELETEDIDHSSEQANQEEDSTEEFGDSEEELDEDQEVLPLSEEASESPLHVLPLYALLSTKQQLKVFEQVPDGHRLCVVSTNVAETSLTIPNIRYVVDSGKAKEKNYDPRTQASSFAVDWTSQASADQRKGRAGRTGPGHCYRLYSSAVFNDRFAQFATPEINRIPIEGVVLQMKSMNIDKVSNFPFPSPPPITSITKAERHLSYLGAIDGDSQITPVGKLMAMFPVAPRYAKMLAIGQQHGCMPYAIAIVAALSVGDPFLKDYQVDTEGDDSEPQKRKFYEALSKFTSKGHQSDLLRVLMAVGAFEYSGGTDEFCVGHFLRPKAMDEIRKLRRQLTNLVQLFCPSVDVSLDPKLAPPTKEQALALRQMLLAGFVDQVAVLKTLVDKGSSKGAYKPKGITGTPAYLTMWGEETVHVHPTSTLYLNDPPPPYLIYSQLSVTSSGVTLMQGVTAIEPKWLISIAKPLVTFSKPLGSSKTIRPRDKKDSVLFQPTFGPKSWPLPNHLVPVTQLKK